MHNCKSNRTTGQQDNKTTGQQDNKTTGQQDNKTTRQQDNRQLDNCKSVHTCTGNDCIQTTTHMDS